MNSNYLVGYQVMFFLGSVLKYAYLMLFSLFVDDSEVLLPQGVDEKDTVKVPQVRKHWTPEENQVIMNVYPLERYFFIRACVTLI